MSRDRRHAGRSPQDQHRPAVEIDEDARRSANELLLDASTPIEQARCCKEECASANRHDTGPAPPRRLDESSNLAAFERAAKTGVAARGDQCVGGATLCRADISNRQIRYKADAGDRSRACADRGRFRPRYRRAAAKAPRRFSYSTWRSRPVFARVQDICHHRLSKLAEKIAERSQEDWRTDTLAAEAGVSARSPSRLFRKELANG